MPQFSIVTPVFNPPRDAFESCVASVQAQVLGDWEWCLCNDASSESWVANRLLQLQNEDLRIKVVNREANGGIVAASNDAISIAGGEFLVLLDNDDVLHADALSLVAAALTRLPESDYLYSDEDKITEDGDHFEEFQKPTWSPERLLAQNYTSHLSVLRRSLVNDVGRFRNGFDGSQDYDLVLRVIERARHIEHIPHVLYHWRSLPTSTASSAAAKPYAFQAALKAVQEHLERNQVPAEVTEAGPSMARIRRRFTRNPEVSIVVPIDGSTRRVYGVESAVATNAITSLTEKTTYNNYEIVLVVPADTDGALLDTLGAKCDRPLRIIRESQTFALGKFLNIGLIASRSRRAVLFDQHCEIIESNWLETLLGYADREHVAAVAPLILDEFGTIVSGGLSFSPEPHDIAAGHHPTELGPTGMFAIARECFGVSTRCALVDVDAIKAVGGFSPEYATRMFDFDLAAKLHNTGLHAIVTPLVTVRSFDDPHVMEQERHLLATRWEHYFGNDPYTRIETRARLQVPAISS